MIFNWLKRKAKGEATLYGSTGRKVDQAYVFWLEASIEEGEVREDRLQTDISTLLAENGSQQLALRLAYDFLYTNSEMHSHAGRVCHILRRVLRGRTQLAGTEHALRAGIEVGHQPSNENLGIC